MSEFKLFERTSPCADCPYRTDAPREKWDRSEFVRVLETETGGEPFGAVYKCHHNHGGICVGWLMDQDRRGMPSIALRFALLKRRAEIPPDYFDRLSSPAPLFESVEEMIEANFPELLDS